MANKKINVIGGGAKFLGTVFKEAAGVVGTLYKSLAKPVLKLLFNLVAIAGEEVAHLAKQHKTGAAAAVAGAIMAYPAANIVGFSPPEMQEFMDIFSSKTLAHATLMFLGAAQGYAAKEVIMRNYQRVSAMHQQKQTLGFAMIAGGLIAAWQGYKHGPEMIEYIMQSPGILTPEIDYDGAQALELAREIVDYQSALLAHAAETGALNNLQLPPEMADVFSRVDPDMDPQAMYRLLAQTAEELDNAEKYVGYNGRHERDLSLASFRIMVGWGGYYLAPKVVLHGWIAIQRGWYKFNQRLEGPRNMGNW